MRLRRIAAAIAAAVLVGLGAAACERSDDEERLAAQRLFRNYLIQSESSAAADVRVQGMVDELPPNFPDRESLELLGSAFTDTDDRRELIVGWQTEMEHADDLYAFYRTALNLAPWSVIDDPRARGIDFIRFEDADNPSFSGELRIAQEGGRAIVVLIATEQFEAEAPSPGA